MNNYVYSAIFMTFVRQRAAEGALLAGNRQEVMGESESLHSMA